MGHRNLFATSFKRVQGGATKWVPRQVFMFVCFNLTIYGVVIHACSWPLTQ